MAYDASAHLQVTVAEYDAFIRRVIPGYEAMLAAAAAIVAERPRALVVELGCGTGALTAAVLAGPVARVRAVDADAGMLALARRRLADAGDRAEFVHGDFADPIPPCDAVAASLALHHIPDYAAKTAVFRAIAGALRPGGVFVNADVTMPADRAAALDAWVAHMVRSGYTAREARNSIAAWSGEDTYFDRDAEVATLRRLGLDAACVWEDVPSTLIVARR